MLIVGEGDAGKLEFAFALDVDLVIAVDQDVGNRRVGHQQFQRPEPEHFVLNVPNQHAPFQIVDLRRVLAQNQLDEGSNLLAQADFGHRFQ